MPAKFTSEKSITIRIALIRLHVRTHNHICSEANTITHHCIRVLTNQRSSFSHINGHRQFGMHVMRGEDEIPKYNL